MENNVIKRSSLLRSAIVWVFIVLFVIAGCERSVEDGGTKERPSGYKINETEDIINIHGRVSNFEKLDDFIEGSSDRQRVVVYTIEGDPIYRDLIRRNDRIELRYDTTKDKFGTPKVYTYMCENLQKVETDVLLSYTLTGCDGESKQMDVLSIPYNAEAQDVFEFAVQYGVNQKNEIDTFNQKLVKDLQNGTVVEVSDFQFTKEERALIYKKLVLANYLTEKKLSTACNQKPHISYHMKVQINGASIDYDWTECDKSQDGQVMTKVVNEIVAIVQAKQEYKTLPATKGAYE